MPAPHNSTVVDSLEFARKQLAIHGTIAVSHFLRLREALSSDEGDLAYRLLGTANDEGQPTLQLQVAGALQLVCQRCMEPFEYKVDIAANFVVVPDEDALPAEADERDDEDYLVADPRMSVTALIEDELLLALPLAPKHDLGQCKASGSLDELKEPSPFAVLEALKTGKSRN